MSRNPFPNPVFTCQADEEFLNRIMVMYLDYAEAKARRHESVTMEQWAEKFNAFLQFDEHELLMNPRKVEAAVARCLAEDCDEVPAATGYTDSEKRRWVARLAKGKHCRKGGGK